MRSSPRPSVAPRRPPRPLVAVPAPDAEPVSARGGPGATFIVLVISALLLGLTLAVASGAGTAGAHSILVRTDPAPGDQVDGLDEVRLEFAHPVSDAGHVVTLHRDGVQVAVASTYEHPEPNTVVARFDQAVPAGGQEIVWDVVAGDGHHERGRIPITLQVPTTGPATSGTGRSAAGAEDPAPPADGSATTPDEGTAAPPADSGDQTGDEPADEGTERAADPPGDDGTTGPTGSVEGAAGVHDDDAEDGSGGGPFVVRLAIAAAVLAAFAYWRRRRLAHPRTGPLDRS